MLVPEGRLSRPFVALLAAAVLAMGSAPFAAAAGAPGEGPPTLEDLSFMVGCWEGELGSGAIIRETYTAPSGGMMLGSSQVVAGGKTLSFEFIQIAAAEAGITYRPFPNGRQTVSFPLARRQAAEAVFENPDHDHPQRIVYRASEPGKLTARIELLDGSRAQEFPMAAVPCGG